MQHDLRANKSVLAKLLAGENINVVHQNIPTAAFDLQTRTLHCPIWEVIDGDLYDLLMGHEVGHALFTPTEGWHGAVSTDANKSILNVCEDARIEKLIKRKYPGLTRPMLRAYKELNARDFFGINKLSDYSKLNLADRINVHFKFGALTNIPFSAEEMEVVNDLTQAETFDEVVDIAKRVSKIMGESKEKGEDQINSLDDLRNEIDAQNSEEQQFDSGEQESDEFNSEDEEEGEHNSDSDSAGESQDSDEDYDDEDEESDSNSGSDFDSEYDDEEDGESSSDEYQFNMDDKTVEELEEQLAKEDGSVTDSIFRAREKELAVNNIKVVNINLPEPNLKNIIEPIDRILDQFSGFYACNKDVDFELVHKQNVRRFSSSNDKVIQLLVKQFLMKRNADQYSRQLTAKTGELDMGKLHKFKFTNDIFAKVTVVPKGKSHGIVMFVDLSGSMNSILPQTIEQLLILASFSRRVNIPFDIYGFSDAHQSTRSGAKFVCDPNVGVDNRQFHLKHMLSSSFSTKVYNQAIKMLMLLAYRNNGMQYGPKPLHFGFDLNSTPLISAILASRAIVDQFKAAHRVDVVNTIYLTDGEETDTITLHEKSNYYPTRISDLMYSTKNDEKLIVRITDRKTRRVMSIDATTSFRNALVSFMRQLTGCNNIGFYIGNSYSIRSRLAQFCNINMIDHMAKKKMMSELKTHNFFSTTVDGFDAYFNVAIRDGMKPSNFQFDPNQIDKKAMKNLAKEFGKNQTSKKSDRIFTSALMEFIC